MKTTCSSSRTGGGARARVAPVVLVTLAALAVALGGCSTQQTASAQASSDDAVTVRVIAFNDFHGHLEGQGLALPWPDPNEPRRVRPLAAGGAAPLAALIRSLRQAMPHHLTLSSGDLVGAAPPISSLFFHESTVDLANRMGVDIAVPGNHEFDAGAQELLRLMSGGCRSPQRGSPAASCALGAHGGAAFAHVAANVRRPDGTTLFPPSVVRGFDGVKVGIVGAVTAATPGMVRPSGVAGLRFTDEAAALNAEAARLKTQGVHALVAVIHEGGEVGTPGGPLAWNDTTCEGARGTGFDIARRLSSDFFLVLTAHTHQGYRCEIDGRVVMQATAQGRGLSVADLVIDRRSGEVDRARSSHRNLPVFNEQSEPRLRDAVIGAEPEPWASALRGARAADDVAERVAAYARAAAPMEQRTVGRINGLFSRDPGPGRTDSAAARLVAQAQWWATREPALGGAQFALMNPGGVRSDLRCPSSPPCEVSFGQVFRMQPFGNHLVTMTLSGLELKRLLEDQQRPGRESPRLLIPSSGLRYTWKASAPHGQRVRDLVLDGRPVAPKDTLRVTVNNFLAEGGDGFTALVHGRERTGGPPDLDALIDFLREGAATPDPEPRVRWED